MLSSSSFLLAGSSPMCHVPCPSFGKGSGFVAVFMCVLLSLLQARVFAVHCMVNSVEMISIL